MHSCNRWISAFALCLLATFSAAASASVVYNWQTLSTTEALFQVEGQLVLSNRAYRQGFADVDINYGYYPFISPIRDIRVELNNAVTAHISPPKESPFFEGRLQAALSTTGNGLNGSIYVNDTETEVGMIGNDGIWNIVLGGSDDRAIGEICYEFHERCNATGRWLLDPSTIHPTVAEPASIVLFAFGLLLVGMMLSDRRRARRAPR